MKQPSRHPRALLALLAATALLAACGGGGDFESAEARQQPQAANIPAKKLPNCPNPAAPLTDITAVQGPGATSPIEGTTVTVRGIVTADFRASGGLGGLFIQQPDPDNDPATSEGLFIFTTDTTAVAVGDYVQATGRVTEFRRSGGDPLTQLAGGATLQRCGAAEPLKPITLTLPVKDANELERTEGMLVRFQQPLYVSGNQSLGRFGELVLSPQLRLYHPNNHPELSPAEARDFNARSRLVLDDTRGIQNPAPIPFLSAADSSGTRRAGDVVKGLEGVLAFDFGAWRLQPTQTPQFDLRNLRTPAPEPVAGSLRVASLNVLNYFTTLNQRGANSSTEFQRQQAKLVETIVAMDADVLGLIEIENNNGVALQALVDAVNARLGAPVYAARAAGVPGDDQITVAVIHKPARVAAVGNVQVISDPAFVVNGGLRPSVAQRFAARDNGGGFWFVINHFKSKGSCPISPTDADADTGQGCFNAARVRQAQALSQWVQQLVAGSGEADVLMAGDFNAYLNEDPLAVLRNAGNENLLARLDPLQRYSYVFDAEAGALDHAFASSSLTPQVSGIAVWHSNADEPPVLDYNTEFKTDDRFAPTPFRASDHDPLVVGLTLAPDGPAAAATLSANLPRAATATQAVSITDIVATPTSGAVDAALTVDWGDGSGPQALALGATTASKTYTAAGSFVITLRLTQTGSLPAELRVPIAVAPAPLVERDLFISEYIEGNSFNKAIELYNPGTLPVDLSRYVLRLFTNGSPTPSQSVTLSGTLAPGATFVICNSGIAVNTACQLNSNSVINFNGDDALRLERDNAVVVDQFGQVGFDPGTAWTDGTVTTIDRTLRRKPGITQGSIPPAGPGVWAVATEWDSYPVNTLDGLGAR